MVRAVPYDVPLVGFGGKTVNNLRLWSAEPAEENFNLAAFNEGNYAEAMRFRSDVEAISQILYPNDSGEHGRLCALNRSISLFVQVFTQFLEVLRKARVRLGQTERFCCHSY